MRASEVYKNLPAGSNTGRFKNLPAGYYRALNHLWRAIIRDFPLGTILLTPEYYSPLQAA